MWEKFAGEQEENNAEEDVWTNSEGARMDSCHERRRLLGKDLGKVS
jgi:hypothetical protein